MNTGKILVSMLVLSAVLSGLAVYYTQVYGFYAPLDEARSPLKSTPSLDDMQPIPLAVTEFRGIDADSSPLRYRSCFRITDMAALEGARPFEGANPAGRAALVFLLFRQGLDRRSGIRRRHRLSSQPEIHPDVDRVIAVYPDGRAYGWHQFNDKTPERGVMD
jgi:hypothetical protein